ncbi:MAG: PilZ domain-containing protein [Bdellovibrionota bacterium]
MPRAVKQKSSKSYHPRRHHRARVDLPVMLIHEEAAHEGRMLSLSRGGALVRTDVKIPTGAKLLMGFHLKNVPDPVELPVEVVYQAKATKDARIGKGQGLGLRFGALDEKLAARIDTYVKDERFFGPYSDLIKEFQRQRPRKR